MKQNQRNKRPDFDVVVVTGEGDKAFWTKIGGAWRHDDGEGYSITLTALPLGDRLLLRTPREKDGREGAR